MPPVGVRAKTILIDTVARFRTTNIRQETSFRRVRYSIDEMGVLQNKSTAELDALWPAILDRAFRGEL